MALPAGGAGAAPPGRGDTPTGTGQGVSPACPQLSQGSEEEEEGLGVMAHGWSRRRGPGG